MKALALFTALMFAGPAFAVPPVPPAPATSALVREFIRATESNDLAAYERLFAADATITNEAGASNDRAQWLKRASAEFVPYRRTRFLNVFTGSAFQSGKRRARVVFVQELHLSRPTAAEHFPVYRTEIITVEGGKIIHLQTSGYLSHRLTDGGEWTFY